MSRHPVPQKPIIRASIKLLLIGMITLVFSLFCLVLVLASKLAKPIYQGGFFHRIQKSAIKNLSAGILRILGIRVALKGKLKTTKPTIMISPHYSWLDPLVLNKALGPNIAFVATKELRSWPIFGTLMEWNDTIFIDRTNRQTLFEQTANIKNALKKGQSVLFFPEGSSGNGNRVRPFKSSLFAVAMDMGVKIQPLSMAYTKLEGIPAMRLFRDYYAWYGDTNFVEHLKQMLGIGKGELVIRVGKLLEPRQFESRKQLTKTAEKWITQDTALLLAGNP